MEQSSAAEPAAEPAVRIRAPLPEEAAEVAAVQNAAWAETYAGLLPATFYDDAALEGRRRMWERLLSSPRPAADSPTARVAEADAALVGVALSGPCEEDSGVREEELSILYVLAAWHGTGTGRRLLEAVLADRPAQLWVAAENARALAFYRRHGFTPDGAESVDAADGMRDLRMVR